MSYRILPVVALVVAAILPLQFAPAVTAAASAPTITAIATGAYHTCALTSEGAVKCWGYNAVGQLGDGSTIDRSTPVSVPGLASGVTAIAAGHYHTCALTSYGRVKCWGSNDHGQLGNGTTTNSPTPVDVSDISSGITAISAGGWHTCALTSGGGVRCWGANDSGQIGYGKPTDPFPYPIDVDELSSGATAMAAGPGHTCAVAAGGEANCWGHNTAGQLGNGSRYDAFSPVKVSGLSGTTIAFATGFDHTCALTSDGGVKCWGANYSGELGDGTTTSSLTPVEVLSLASGVRALAPGASWAHTCALTNLGAIKCWGFNAYGQLGNGSAVDSRLPVDVLGLASGVKAVAVGHYHTCALTNEGGVRCWGDNYGGALGNGSDVDSTTPVIVDFTTHQITRETIGLRTSVPAGAIPRGMVATFVATVRPVGADGTKATVHFVVYHRVSGVWRQATHRDVIADATGRATLRWSFSTGGAWYVRAKVLGNASYAASGWSPQFRYTVINASMPTNIAITAGYSHTCALTDRGGVRCWGDNDIGQLGNSTTTDSLVPVDVASLASGVTAIAAGNGHTCALMGDGGVRCWGYNGFGELGNGTTTKSLIPVDVTSLASDATAIFAGDDHTCALTSAGRVKCWGSNDFGQLGNGSITSYSSIPVVAGLPSGVVAIAGGFGTTCALTSAGGVRCWGTGFQGQLGNGQTSDSLTPVDVTGLARGVAAIAAGSYQTCALTSGGGVKCWGVGASGQLGDSTVADSAVPIVVTGLGSGVTAVAVGTIHRCALTMGGGVKCWGWDRSGQLGDGKVTPSSVPVDVWGLGTGVTAIAAGTTHSCALMKSGGVKCWGANDSGQLGNGRTTDSSVPVDVKFGT